MKLIGAMGLIALVGTILVAVGVFTKDWYGLSVTVGPISTGKTWFGIVPFHSNAVGWFNVASWFMFIGFAFGILLVLQVAALGHQYHQHGCCHRLTKQSIFTGIFAIIAAILVVISFVIFFAKYSSIGVSLVSISLGFSPFLCLAGGIFFAIVGGLAFFFAHHLHDG